MRLIPNFLAVTLAATLAITACTENPATGANSFTLVSSAQERQIGQQSAQAMLKQYGMYRPSSVATQYVTNLCQRMFAVTESAAEPLSCILLDSDTYNAWATPGYINVYRGFLPFVQTEAQLAAVLAHEAGHISARHIARGATQNILAGLAVSALGIYLGSELGDNATTRTALQLGGLAAGFATAKFGRDHEREADTLAQRYLPRAGYDAREAASMVQTMQNYEAYMNQFVMALKGEDPGNRDIFSALTSSHPPTPERLQAAITRFGPPDGTVQLPEGSQPATPKTDPQGRKRFHQAIDGLAWGPQRSWGIAGRTYIAIPQARVKVRIPEGFVTKYFEGPEKPEKEGIWQGRHPLSDTRFKLATIPYTAGMNVGNLLGEMGVENIQRLQLTDGTVAYTGTKTTQGRIHRGVAIPSPQTENAVVVMVSFPDAATQTREEPAIMQTLTQSQVVSEAVASRWEPLKIRVYTTGAGDTPTRLAEGMAVGALRVELFNALNGLAPGDPLPPGSVVKRVVDENVH